uniref:C-type lectin domain-containing protein n=1 Tax=Sinocyclocheilus anshuiensis TaxID=1608454 RepID=A0A671SEJ4_9TELE
ILFTFTIFMISSTSGRFPSTYHWFVADHVNVIGQCPMPQSCSKHGFTDWYKVQSLCQILQKVIKCSSCVLSSSHNDYLLCIVKKFNPNNLRIWLGSFELFKVKRLFVRLTNRGSEENELSCFECLEMNWKEIGRWNDDSCFVKKNYICAFKQ